MRLRSVMSRRNPGEHRRIAYGNPRDRQLDYDLAALGGDRWKLHPSAEDGTFPALAKVRETLPVGPAKALGDDQLRQLASYRLASSIPERPFGGWIELQNVSAIVDRDDAIQRRFEDGVPAAACGDEPTVGQSREERQRDDHDRARCDHPAQLLGRDHVGGRS
jgi:hypothetical protein